VQAAIAITHLSKQFRRQDPNRPHTLQEWLVQGMRRWRNQDTFWALHDVTLTIPPGRMVGLIGHNGAGKSTLLRLIGGVGRADGGTVDVHGRIGALLDLGSGLNDDLTGRENIFLNGVIGGLTRRQVAERFDDIVAFAELAEVIEAPLRTYSTGMKMRLAFAVAVHIDPDILLIDEVLAVGDIAFQQKCLTRIAEFRQRGCTILLVTHDATVVGEMCDEAIWLQNGRLVAQGPAKLVAADYTAAMASETRRRTPSADKGPLRLNENRFGSLEMEITAVSLHSSANAITSGDPLSITLTYHAPDPAKRPIFGVTISREDGFICYETSIPALDLTTPPFPTTGTIRLNLERLDLAPGDYYVDVGLYEESWAYAYDYHWHAYPIQITGHKQEKGILRPPQQWQFLPPENLTEQNQTP
jgi:lipopolysaccharide transport system ATP-binding protein